MEKGQTLVAGSLYQSSQNLLLSFLYLCSSSNRISPIDAMQTSSFQFPPCLALTRSNQSSRPEEVLK